VLEVAVLLLVIYAELRFHWIEKRIKRMVMENKEDLDNELSAVEGSEAAAEARVDDKIAALEARIAAAAGESAADLTAEITRLKDLQAKLDAVEAPAPPPTEPTA
jgi:hypothetical protein